MLRKYDRNLRKYCKEQVRNPDITPGAVWVTDNYRACSSALKAAIGFLSHEGEKDLMPLFFMCQEYFLRGEELSFERLSVKFSSEKLSVFQCEALPVLLFAAASSVISDNIYEDNEELKISCVKNLIKLREIDFDAMLYDICKVERYLCEDPVGLYEQMSRETKKQYRYSVMKAAVKEGITECEFVKKALERANEENRHIGFYLPVKKDESSLGLVYIVSEWVLSALISLFLGIFFIKEIYAPFILIFPVYAVIKPLSDRLCVKLFKPYKLPTLNENIVTDAKTLITVSTLLPSASKAGELFSHLSEVYASNTLPGVKLLLLADMKNAPLPEDPSDSADISAVKRLIDELNKKHGGGFSVAVRDRVFSHGENEYTGFERKRGAISALTKYLRDGNENHFALVYGDTEGFSEMKYIMALDSDTSMSFEVLRGLLAVAEHPLNAPEFSSLERRIVSGYGIITPRVETSIASSEKTVFSRIFTNGGSVSYSPKINERYMDMFGKSIFSGKGLINIDAFNITVTDKFDEQRILSHDILEGSVLRTAFCAESELTDSFPSSAEGYFSRLHRWIRGDIQNIKYIFMPLGKKDASPEMPKLGKYQLFDNMRRALTPVFSFVLLILSCFMPYYDSAVYLTLGILAVTADYIVSVISAFIRSGMRAFSSLYFSSEITSANKDILKALMGIGALPQTAFISLDAVIKSAYRSLISHKKLLQWQTAADADSKTRKNIFSAGIIPTLTVILFFVTGTAWHRLFSFLIIFFMPLALSKGIKLPRKKEKPLSENESRIISSFAAASWRFFEENVTALENWLPPDNIQETPVPRKAKRTSPTNIGFYLVSTLAAADLSFISGEELLKRISDTLNTIDKLPKYKGLLYNWYDTVRMLPLRPSYVSTVDCGNYLVCLCALKEGLKEYRNIHPGFNELIVKIENILSESDLSFLYDKTRNLFRIGIDCESGELSSSFYDLYMSEARMTSYYECAKRHVPARHWSSLDRTLKRSANYVTAASWTGTMFEYFLPALFLDTVENSFQYEALKVCLYAQKKRVRKENIPYGISESCFYSVDTSLNYRYKAHGIKNLALKREADDESVISPYSTFLTLPFDRKSAMKNLGKLSSLHAEGRYGFYEAVDFSRERTEGEDYLIVRSYMSHHVGMSIIAMANTLLDNIFVKRFMADMSMKSAKVLLEEKIPSHPNEMRSFSEKRIMEKSISGNNRSAPEEGSEVFAYSNGEVTLFCDKFGRNTSVFAASRMYKYSDRSEGISVGIEYDGVILPLFPFDENSVKLKKYAMSVKTRLQDIDIYSALMVHPTENALLVPVKIKNTGTDTVSVNVHYYIEPYLLPYEKEDAHPAFSDMFLKVKDDKKHRSLVFYRSNSESSPALALGFYGKNKSVYNLDREKVIERMTDAESVFFRSYSCEMNDIRGVSPVAAISAEISLQAGKSTECVLILAFGGEKNTAEYVLSRVRNQALPLLTKGAAATFLRDKLTFNAASSLIARTFFNGTAGSAEKTAGNALKEGIGALWQVGISGDFPIIAVFPEKNCPLLLQKAFVRLHKRLSMASISTDLVFIFEKTADYGFTGERDLHKIIAEEGMNDAIGKSGGIHMFSLSSLPKESFTAILAFSKYVYPNSDGISEVKRKFIPLLSETLPVLEEENSFIKDGYLINRRPLLPWCHTLSNNTFGTLVSDRSLGYTWAYNSRQNKITPWSNDASTDFSGERLFLICDGNMYDIVSNASVVFTPSYAQYRCFAGDITVVSTVEVAKKGARKRISVFTENNSDENREIKLIYCVFPVLGEDNSRRNFIKIHKGDRFIAAENPMNEDYKGVLYLSSPDENAVFSDTEENLYENIEKKLIILQKIVIEGKKSKTARFNMCFADDINAAAKLSEINFITKEKKRVAFNTGYKEFDEFASALLYHQVSDTRLRARCGFYQCSGAFGFRDQLQDILPLIGRENSSVRQMIFKAASAQFPEGDVLHWFHRIYKDRLIYKGIRSRCSDDMLWLPYAVSRYVLKSGDSSILDKSIPFLQGERLHDGQNENYGEYVHSEKHADLYTHCLYAIKVALKTGEHSLPLIGSGDWNDSFDEVGIGGKGESVWLGMFLRKVLLEFAKICEIRKDKKMSEQLKGAAQKLASVIDENAWNGKWYLRGFYDDGTPLGSEGDSSCEIDLLCESWSSLSDMPDKSRIKTALLHVYEKLFDEKNGVIKLFSPPFSENGKKTGYVNFYPEGMRENGGQYTHAAVWFAMALFKEGLKEQGEKVLFALIPSEKYKNGKGDTYKTEPYAMAGDVYSAKGHEGRGGWSLYTGSAGWMIQLADMLGD